MLALQPGMERLSHEMRDRQVRLHSVSTDLELDLPPNIALPDGEEIPYGSSTRLQIRDPEQESEIYQKCIRPPPNRTVFDGESPPPYRSSSAGLLALGAGAGASDWSSGSGSSGPHVVRCHSLSSSSSSSASTSSTGSSTNSSSTSSRRPRCRHRCPRADRRFRPRSRPRRHRPLRRVAHPSPLRLLGSPGRGRRPRQSHHGALPDGRRATVVAPAVLHNPLRLPAPAASAAAATPPPAAASSPPSPSPPPPSPPPPAAARRQARAVGRRGRGARLTGPSPPAPIVITSLSAVSLGPHCLRE